MRWHAPDDPDWVIAHIPSSPQLLTAQLPEAPPDLRKQHQSTRFPLAVLFLTLYVLMWCQLYEPSSQATPSRTQESSIDWSRLSLTPPPPVEGDPLNRFEPPYVRRGKPLARLVNGRVILQYNGTITSPLTSLGLEADASYKIETDDLHEYLATLEAFVRGHFPKSDSDEKDSQSLINDLRAHFPMHRPVKTGPRAPKRLFQVKGIPKTEEASQATRKALTSWLTMNHPIEIILRDEEDVGRWMASIFRRAPNVPAPSALREQKQEHLELERLPADHRLDGEKTHSQAARTFLDLWQDGTIPIEVRTRLYQYLILAVEGGIWAGQGTTSRKSIEEWGLTSPLPRGWTEPALLLAVGYEASGAGWNKNHKRPLEINGHVLRAARGHPIIIDALRRLYHSLQNPHRINRNDDCLTDALMNWLLVRWSLPWSELRHTSGKGSWRVRDHREWSDVLVLPRESLSEPNGLGKPPSLQLVVPQPRG
ncbi:BQ5605_C004g02601 [Microbotryum silenes-dioicae]|uniref:BQ5605_C004g02601 protein n=1 Tax=Microbotryum silenes-dioicae TaxID=796604 RepID=A0A2X0P3V4_9BASI|nr:BQ5605_C004g02601 [Microbotryum silenes-dioicae]